MLAVVVSCVHRSAPPAAAPYRPEEAQLLTPPDIRLKILGTWKRSGPASSREPAISLSFRADGSMVMNRMDFPEVNGWWRVLLPHGNNTFLTSLDGTNYLSQYIILRLDDHDLAFEAFEPSTAPPPNIQRYIR